MQQPPKYTITYTPPRGFNRWQVELRQGNRTVDSWSVDTRVEAIAKAKELQSQFPTATFQLCTLGVVNAWKTPSGWFYSATESHEGSVRALALDELGDIVLQITNGDETQFIDGARKI